MARSATFQGQFGGDPMELYAGKQARERRQQPQPRRDVTNSPLPDWPRRWEKDDGPWTPARQRAEAFFAGIPEQTESPSEARRLAEALFGKP